MVPCTAIYTTQVTEALTAQKKFPSDTSAINWLLDDPARKSIIERLEALTQTEVMQIRKAEGVNSGDTLLARMSRLDLSALMKRRLEHFLRAALPCAPCALER